ncbi:endolytic transglycosylase MltG [Treponema sp.]
MNSIIKRIFRLLSISLAALLLLILGLFLGIRFFDSAPEPNLDQVKIEEGAILFTLETGEADSSVGKRLEQAGLIRSSLFWTILARLDKDSVKAGIYRIEVPSTMFSIRELLVSGKQVLVRVTVPEGFTLRKIATLLESAGICSSRDFLEASRSQDLRTRYGIPSQSMEGYLYPDTYYFPHDFPALQVVRTMADTFFKKIALIDPASQSLSSDELFERVVIASIVEREYRAPDEAPLMAGVFYNRLKIGMGLQSCATVEYVITEIQGKVHPEVLYNRDIAIDNPFNTCVQRNSPSPHLRPWPCGPFCSL